MSQTIATLSSVSDNLDTFAKLVRVIEKEGVAWEDLIRPINNLTARRNLAEYLQAGCPKMPVAPVPDKVVQTSVPLPDAYLAAAKILGQDFIPPEELAQARGVSYTDEQLKTFADTLPTQEVLEWCQKNGFMVVAGPPQPLSLLQIREMKPEYFYTKEGGWYAEECEKFSREQKVTTQWLMLRKEPVPNSLNKTWDAQKKLLSEVEYVPNDAEVEWGITTYKVVRNIYLLRGGYVRTSSVGSLRHRVLVGFFDASGLVVDDSYVVSGWGGVGVASARKLQIAT